MARTKKHAMDEQLKKDYAELVECTSLLLIVLATRNPEYTVEALTTQFAINVRYVAGLHGSTTQH